MDLRDEGRTVSVQEAIDLVNTGNEVLRECSVVGMAYDEEESDTSAHYRVQLILSVADAFVS